MDKSEDTPFATGFNQRNQNNYGSAMQSDSNTTPRSSTSRARAVNMQLPRSNTNLNNNNAAAAVSSAAAAATAAGQDTPSIILCLHGKSKIEVRDHCHRQRSEGVDVNARKKLIIASVLCLFFMICEIIGGVLSNSLAIATDAAHLLTDFASFMISLFAIWIAGRPSTQRMSFGWYRAEVIGALASVVMIWVITAILVWVAIERLINQDFEVDSKIMLITSGLAILVNLIMGCQLQHGHTHGGGHGHAGHSHVPSLFKRKSKKSQLQRPVADKLSNTLALDAVEGAPDKRNSVDPEAAREFCSLDSTCPETPRERIENGAIALPADDSQLPAVGQPTYSYQNSAPGTQLHAEIPAVRTESAHGATSKDTQNINVRAAYIHVLGDMLQSVGVFLAALTIYFRPDWVIVDPICTFVFSVIVLFTTFAIMKDTLLVLMEGTPGYLHYAEVLNIFQQIEGVERVHNLRIWALSINKIALSVHLAIAPGANPKKILQDATSAVHVRYNFFETTIQIEDFTPQMENCQQCSVPGN